MKLKNLSRKIAAMTWAAVGLTLCVPPSSAQEGIIPDPASIRKHFRPLICILWMSLSSCTSCTRPQVSEAPSATVCTQEAKLCPDGSSVSRVGTKCEFALCPGEPR